MRNLFTLGREGTTKLGSRAQEYKHALKLSRNIQKKSVADGEEFYDLAMNERDTKLKKKKITTRNISEINN